jgi:hypothetical protein
MLSQPATKIFLRTSGHMPRSGSPTRSGKSRSSACARAGRKGGTRNGASGWNGKSSRQSCPAISGLPSLRGYLKLENLVVRLHFPFVDVPARHPAFVERPTPETPRSAALPAPSAAVVQSPVPDTHIARAAGHRATGPATTVLPVVTAYAHDLQAVEREPGAPLSRSRAIATLSGKPRLAFPNCPASSR